MASEGLGDSAPAGGTDARARRGGLREPPGGDPPGRKQVEQPHHQHQTTQAVIHQQGNPVFNQLPGFVVNLDIYGGRQGRAGIRQPGLKHPRGGQGVAVFRPLKLQLYGGHAVVFNDRLVVPGLRADGG